MKMQERTRRLINELRSLAASGHTMKQASEIVGLGYQRVSYIGRQYDIIFRRPSGESSPCEARNSEICRRYLAGEVQADLAREFRITRERIRQICERAGLVAERKRHADFVATAIGMIIRHNLTVSEAAARFNVSKNVIYLWCHSHEVKPSRLTAGERAELEALSKKVINGDSINKAAEGDSNKANKLARFLKQSGIKARGRSRHDDFTHRKRLVAKWRGIGLDWEECATLLSKHDGRSLTKGALVVWCRRHMPELFKTRKRKATPRVSSGEFGVSA